MPLDMLRQDLARFGDCVLVVGTSDVAGSYSYKPSREGSEHCIRRGELHEIKIDNMAYQHDEFEEVRLQRNDTLLTMVRKIQFKDAVAPKEHSPEKPVEL